MKFNSGFNSDLHVHFTVAKAFILQRVGHYFHLHICIPSNLILHEPSNLLISHFHSPPTVRLLSEYLQQQCVILKLRKHLKMLEWYFKINNNTAIQIFHS